MKRLKFLAASLLCSTAMMAQPPVKISWAGELNCERCLLDSVVVTNKSSGEKLVFYYPDTVLVCGEDSVGIKPLQVTSNKLRVTSYEFFQTLFPAVRK